MDGFRSAPLLRLLSVPMVAAYTAAGFWGDETIYRLAGPQKLIVAGHDPQVADRFKQVADGIVKIA